MSKSLDIVIETSRLFLRKLNLNDAVDMFDYTSNDTVTEFLSWNAHTSIDQTKSFIEKTIDIDKSNKSFTWGIIDKSNNKLIGVARVFDVSFYNRRLELSYILNPKFQGKGYMLEALKALIDCMIKEYDINRIQARCTTNNISSKIIMEKLGMKFEGKLKDYWILKEVVCDALLYALTSNKITSKY